MNATVAAVSHRASVWDDFLEVSRPDIGFKQSSWWVDFLVTRGWDHFGVTLRKTEAILGGANVLRKSFAPGKCFYYLPHGPVLPEGDGDAEEAFEAIMAYIDDKRKADSRVVSHLRIEPRWLHRPVSLHGFREATGYMDPRHTLCMDLSLSEDAILEQMKQKGRYNVRVARRNGVSIVNDISPQGVADFIDIYNGTFERHGLRGHSIRYFHNLMERLIAFDCGTLSFAEYQGMRLATALIIYFGDTATYKYGGSLPDHRHVMAPYLLHFEVMMNAKARGYGWYDFYGIAPSDKPDHRWANFSAFKRKFGGCERSFVPALDFVYDADAYEDYRRRK